MVNIVNLTIESPRRQNSEDICEGVSRLGRGATLLWVAPFHQMGSGL